MASGSSRMSAEERRESVIRAAVTEFGRGGYEGTSTAAIARRVGVSQPYLFRLFPDKRAIFLAAADRCCTEIHDRLAEVSDGLSPEEAHGAMAAAYDRLISRRDQLLFQMQMYAAAAVAEERGDHAFAADLRTYWERVWELVHRRLGGDEQVTTTFMGTGMLINTLLSLGFPHDHPIWAACGPDLHE